MHIFHSIVAGEQQWVPRGKRICIVLFLCIAGLMASSVCAGEKQQALSGSFISDSEATMAYLSSTGVYSAEQLEKIGSVMGKMKVIFTGNTVVTEREGDKTSEQFTIAEEGEGYIVILTSLDKEPVRNRIEFVSDGYWLVHPNGEKPFREKFRRIP